MIFGFSNLILYRNRLPFATFFFLALLLSGKSSLAQPASRQSIYVMRGGISNGLSNCNSNIYLSFMLRFGFVHLIHTMLYVLVCCFAGHGDRFYVHPSTKELLLQSRAGAFLWRNGVSDETITHYTMQGDGNFVAYATGGLVKWSAKSNTGIERGPYTMTLLNNQNVEWRESDGGLVWETGTPSLEMDEPCPTPAPAQQPPMPQTTRAPVPTNVLCTTYGSDCAVCVQRAEHKDFRDCSFCASSNRCIEQGGGCPEPTLEAVVQCGGSKEAPASSTVVVSSPPIGDISSTPRAGSMSPRSRNVHAAERTCCG